MILHCKGAHGSVLQVVIVDHKDAFTRLCRNERSDNADSLIPGRESVELKIPRVLGFWNLKFPKPYFTTFFLKKRDLEVDD